MILLAAASSLHAQTPIYWDIAGTSLWNTNANWAPNPDGTGAGVAPANSLTTNSAVFSVANGNTAAQLSGNRSIQGITFNNTGTTAINTDGVANRTLALGAGGLTLNSGAGAVTFGTTTNLQRVIFTIGANQTWTNNSSNALAFNTNNTIGTNGNVLTLDGTGGFGSAGNGIRLQGTGSTVKNGDGGLFIASNTQSGDFTLNSGSISPQVASNAFGTGILKINGGSISTTGGNRTFGNSAYELNGTVLLSGGNSIHSLTFNTGNVSLLGSSTINVSTITANMNTAISGDSLGLTKGNDGTLNLNGANTYTGATLVSAGTLLVNGSLGASAVTVENGATFGGSGTIGSTLALGATSSFRVVDLNDALGVTGTITFGSGFGIANLLGINWDSVGIGSHTLISTSQTFSASDIANFGFDNRVAVGTLGREAYFTNGSLSVVVIPEPGAALLGGLGMLAILRRRRTA